MEEFKQATLFVGNGNIFEELKLSVGFENVCGGRQGTVLVDPDTCRGTPIVRTTTTYHTAPYCFQAVHKDIVAKIQEKIPKVTFKPNNALIEYYNNSYFKMGPHTDQAQDLEGDTYIAIFSCYKNPEIAKKHPRKLVVQSKVDNSWFEIPMNHNSVIVFSLETNQHFRHKIVLDIGRNPPKNEWLGITLRTSKTFVQHSESGEAHLEDGTPFLLADDAQRKEFFKMRRCENQQIHFEYPLLAYTISPSDLMQPSKLPPKEKEEKKEES